MNLKKLRLLAIAFTLLIVLALGANFALAQSSSGFYKIYCCTYKCTPGKCESSYFNGGWACVAADFSKAEVQCTQTDDSQTWRNTCVSSLNNRNDDTHTCLNDGDPCTACLVLSSYRLTDLSKGYSCEYPPKADSYCLKHDALESSTKQGY